MDIFFIKQYTTALGIQAVLAAGLLLGTLFLIKPDANFESHLSEQIENYKKGSASDIELIQGSWWKCCGLRGEQDYKSFKIPKSCCRSNKVNTKGECEGDSVTWQGCLSQYLRYVDWYRGMVRNMLYVMVPLNFWISSA